MRYINDTPTRGRRAWEPLSTQYPKEFRTWNTISTRRYQSNYKRLNPLWDEDLYWDFELFLKEVGPVFSQSKTECSLDRIDNDKGYVKGNLRWATRSEQMRNRRHSTHLIEWNKCNATQYEGKTLAQWGEETGIRPGTLYRRINQLGWNLQRALNTPVLASSMTS